MKKKLSTGVILKLFCIEDRQADHRYELHWHISSTSHTSLQKHSWSKYRLECIALHTQIWTLWAKTRYNFGERKRTREKKRRARLEKILTSCILSTILECARKTPLSSSDDVPISPIFPISDSISPREEERVNALVGFEPISTLNDNQERNERNERR